MGITIQEWCSATRVPGVTFTMSQEMIEKLANACRELACATSTVPRKQVRQLAGLATWIAGVLPQLTAYSAMLWAAVACAKHGRVDAAHVRRPLAWLLQFCRDGFRRVERHCRREADYYTVITFDGSFTGGGATLQCGVPTLEAARTMKVIAYFHVQWDDDDLKLLQVRRGDPQGQARVEA